MSIFLEKNLFYPKNVIELLADFYAINLAKFESPRFERASLEVLDFTEEKIFKGLQNYWLWDTYIVFVRFVLRGNDDFKSLLINNINNLLTKNQENLTESDVFDAFNASLSKYMGISDFASKFPAVQIIWAQSILGLQEYDGGFYEKTFYEFGYSKEDVENIIGKIDHEYPPLLLAYDSSASEDFLELQDLLQHPDLEDILNINEHFPNTPSQKLDLAKGSRDFLAGMGSDKSWQTIDHIIDLSHANGLFLL